MARPFPVRYVHGNILFGPGNERAALYRVNTVSYPYLPGTSKYDWFGRMAQFAFATQANFSMWRVCRTYPFETYIDRAMPMCDTARVNEDAWRTFLEGHRDHLRDREPFVPEVYIAVQMADQARQRFGEKLLRATERVSIRRGPTIPRTDIEALLESEVHVLHRASANLPIRRATTREIQWLLRRTVCRGYGEPNIDNYWAPAAIETDGRVTPLETDVWRLLNAPRTEGDRTLVFEAEEGQSHQTMLALGHLPETSEFPDGAELLCTPLEATPFPVDVAVHVRWMANRDAGGIVRKRVMDADNNYSEQLVSAHGPLSYTAEENRVLARELDSYLKIPERPPLLRATVSLAVGAPDNDSLEKRVESLRHRYGTTTLHRPLGLQEALFFDHLLRADVGTVRDYEDVWTVEQFGALMPIGTHGSGGYRGVLIGHATGGGARPVTFDITEASREGRPPSILLAGSLGSGKTIAAELLTYQAAMRGSVVVDVDPKPDHNLEELPELQGRVRVIELSGDERYRGLLDPLMHAPEGIREELAHSYLMDLLPNAPSMETFVRRAVKQVLTTCPSPCCMAVVDALKAMTEREAKGVGLALETWADSGIARLGFGVGLSNGDSGVAPTAQITSIKASMLSLPGPGVARADYDSAERLAVATLKLVAAYAMRLVQGSRNVHKVVLFDEAWFMLESADGRRLLDRLNRMGRSENATLILATQQLGDVSALEALIGTRILFGMETRAEAMRGLEMLGHDPDDTRLVERIRGYRRGRGLMRDVHDNITEIQIETVFPHLLETLDTTPRERVPA